MSITAILTDLSADKCSINVQWIHPYRDFSQKPWITQVVLLLKANSIVILTDLSADALFSDVFLNHGSNKKFVL